MLFSNPYQLTINNIRDCFITGPSPGFRSRGAKNQKEGPETRRGATF